MSSKFFAAAAALAMISGPALAGSQNEQGAASTEAKAGKEERKICRTFDNTASRMKREKVCLTRSEWKKFDANQ